MAYGNIACVGLLIPWVGLLIAWLALLIAWLGLFFPGAGGVCPCIIAMFLRCMYFFASGVRYGFVWGLPREVMMSPP